MWFNVKEARDFLLTNGFVYTLRPKKRREGREALMYEGFGKKGELQVRFVKEIESDEELQTRVERSGFRSVEEWRKKAGDSRFLYLVGLVSLEHMPTCPKCKKTIDHFSAYSQETATFVATLRTDGDFDYYLEYCTDEEGPSKITDFACPRCDQILFIAKADAISFLKQSEGRRGNED